MSKKVENHCHNFDFLDYNYYLACHNFYILYNYDLSKHDFFPYVEEISFYKLEHAMHSAFILEQSALSFKSCKPFISVSLTSIRADRAKCEMTTRLKIITCTICP